MFRHCAMTVLAVACAAAPVLAQSTPQVQVPTSPSGSAEIEVGGTWQKTENGGQQYQGGKWLRVEYSRPILRGRENILGSGADYGKTVKGSDALWRAGANASTRLTTQATLQVGDKTVPPGVYNVLVDLKDGAWTLVLTNQPSLAKFDPQDKVHLYGATNYDAKFDVARAPMTVSRIEPQIEQFTIGFINADSSGVTLAMWWDHTMATVRLGTK